MNTTEDDPVHRLVASITGQHATRDLVSLANRVLSSQIGNNSSDVMDTKDLSATWRRISRKAPNPNTAKEDVERIYRQYERGAADHPDVPPKVLAVLAKLTGKRIPTFTPPASSLPSLQTNPKPATTSATTTSLTTTRAEPTTRNDANAKAPSSPQRRFSPAKQRLIAYNQQHSAHTRQSQQVSASRQAALSPSQEQEQQQKKHQPTPINRHAQDHPSSSAAISARSSSSPERMKRAALKYGLPGQQTRSQPRQQIEESNYENNDKPSSSLDADFEHEKQSLQNEEAMLLRECLYSLQGIDGERIRYYRREPWDNRLPDVHTYEGIRCQSKAIDQTLFYSGQVLDTRLGTGPLDALRICGEAGWLYSRIQSYVQEVQQEQAKGVVARAFAETLAEQLRDYHSLLTTYETRLPDFSLRQLMIELKGPTNRLKILAMLTDGLRPYTGGHLLSALYRHSMHGNSVHVNIVQTLLSKASRPWFEIFRMWTTQGVLSDPWNEFFVVENPNVDDKFLWTDKYIIDHERVPIGILDENLVIPAFTVGKGINFIRRCLMDGQWTMNLSLLSSMGASESLDDRSMDNGIDGSNDRQLGYRYVPFDDSHSQNILLQKTTNKALELVHSHVLRTLNEENHLIQHLFALKQFLFLGQGDFFSSLMEGLHHEYSNAGEPGGVSSIYKHSLLAIVEGALRSTNAKYLPAYTIDRLQVELLLHPGEQFGDVIGNNNAAEEEKQLENHRTVYDIFLLDYQVPDPIIAIVHPSAMDRYKSVFTLLFRLKKIEFMLNYTWRQSATLSHALQTSAQYTGIDIHSSEGYAEATYLLRNVSILRQSMMHFVVNLKSYLMFEVIEGGWQRLRKAIEDAGTLDETIEAHDAYLNSIIRKAMVKDREHNDPTLNNLADQVATVLAITDEFCSLQEIIFNQSLRAADIAAEKRVEAESRMNRGQWGFDSEQDMEEQETFFGLAEQAILEEVRRISESYNDHTLVLLRALNEKVNGSGSDLAENDANLENVVSASRRIREIRDDDLDPQRFLIAQLDHNQYYAGQALDAQ